MARKLKRGDRVIVRWVDIQESPGGELPDAKVAEMETIGYFIEWKAGGLGRVLVTSNTIHGNSFYGWAAYPEGCVRSVKHDG